MKVGYLHAGAGYHGVNRYGRLLAGETARRPDVVVVESGLELGVSASADEDNLAAAVARLRSADVVHIQYNSHPNASVWGPGWRQLSNLRRFVRAVERPVVVTVHDLYPVLRLQRLLRHPLRSFVGLGGAIPQITTLNWLQRHAARLLVCSEEERERLGAGSGRVTVIPHFVESRSITASRATAKAALGWTGRRVISVLGFIHRRKGHQLVVDALAKLPGDVIAVFAGGATPSDPGSIDRLRTRALARGVDERLFVTGYLAEPDLQMHLAATDLAVCPFVQLSASGSLSTWISASRSIVASHLPQIAEYNALEPGAIRTFEPYTAGALAAAISAALRRDEGEADTAVARLRHRLLLPSIAERHVDAYRSLIQRQATSTAVGSVSAQT